MRFAIKLVAASAILATAGSAFAQKGETVKIAWIDPLSGLMAPVGQNQVKSFQFFAEKFNATNPAGVKFEIIAIDNKLSPAESLNALKSAIDQGVRYVDTADAFEIAAKVSGLKKLDVGLAAASGIGLKTRKSGGIHTRRWRDGCFIHYRRRFRSHTHRFVLHHGGGNIVLFVGRHRIVGCDVPVRIANIFKEIFLFLFEFLRNGILNTPLIRNFINQGAWGDVKNDQQK